MQCLPGWRAGRYIMFTWMASWVICNVYLDGELAICNVYLDGELDDM